MRVVVKVHETPNGRMLAVCDAGLLGRTFEQGDCRLDLSASFYQGDEVSVEEAGALLEDVYVVNAVGEDSVGLLVGRKLVEKDNVLEVDGVPYAQCVVER